MVTAVVAALIGLVVGRATRGRFSAVAEHPVRTWPLLGGGAALQLVAHVGAERLAYPLVLLSYVALAAFAARNLHLVGMGLVLVAITVNGGVIALNHGMPVRPEAAADAGVRELGPAHHLERDSDRLLVLADVIPLRATGEVLSLGDLVFAVGLADVTARVLHPRPRRSVLRGRQGLRRRDLRPLMSQ